MRKDSFSLIPSFDSIPCLSKQGGFFGTQMKFIVSKKQILSFESLEDDLPNNAQLAQQAWMEGCEEKRIDERQKVVVMGTFESFKTPKKKKKTGCVCKKTGCLKLYCECFSSGKTCTEECSCCNCSNLVENGHEIQSARTIRKNRCKNTAQKKACNCRKSQCQKKYCQCFNAAVACNSDCKCEGCANLDHHSHQTL